MNNLKKCFFGYSWYGRLFGLRILFVIKFLTNLFFLSFLLLIFFLIFVNFLLTSHRAPVFFFYVEPQFLTQRSWRLLLGHSVTRISPSTGPREKATFLFLGEARNWLFGFRSFWRENALTASTNHMSFPYLGQDFCSFSVDPSLLLGLENPPIACLTSGPYSSPWFPTFQPFGCRWP